MGTSLVVHWLRLCDPNAGSAGLIPGQVTKTPAVMVQPTKQKSKSKNCKVIRRKGKFWCKNGKEHMQNFKITNPKGKIGHFDDTKFKDFC